MSFNPLPFPPRNPLVEVMLREFPWMLSEWCSVSIFCNQHSVFHTAPHLKVLYSQIKIHKQTCRSTFASWMPVGLVYVNNPKFRYLQGSCPPGGLNATSNRSRLIWTTLSATTHRGCWSWRGVILDSVLRSICFILLHVRTDG